MALSNAFTIDIKAVDDEGTFDAYLSKFGDEDLDGDIVERGAFSKSLREHRNANRRPLLWQHNPGAPIGVLEAREDDVGLRVKGTINLEVAAGREAHSLVKQGAIDSMSQGFIPVKWERRSDHPHGRKLQEIDLWEGSLVTFPALPSANVLSVRTALKEAMPRWADEQAQFEQRAATAAALAELCQTGTELRDLALRAAKV